MAKATGVSGAKIAAIKAGQITDDEFSEVEKALLAFVDEVIAGPEVSDPVFETARKHFSDQALVEVVTMQGFYYSLARVATVFRVDPEQSSRESVKGSAKEVEDVSSTS